MGEPTIEDLQAEFAKSAGGDADLPEAGATHYLKRGALQGVSALADMPVNVAKLARAGAGMWMHKLTGDTKYLPDVGHANAIGNFLLENTQSNLAPGQSLADPARPASYIGPMGAAALEGVGAGFGQGPAGILRQAPTAMAKQLAVQQARNSGLGALGGSGAYLGGEATGGSEWGQLGGGILAGVVAPSSFLRKGGVTVGAMRAAAETASDAEAMRLRAALAQATVGQKIAPQFGEFVNSQVRSAAVGAGPDTANNLTEGLRLRNQIPGFNPSVAEMSNAPGLMDMQNKYARSNPQALNEEVARMRANDKAIDDYYRTIVPAAEAPSQVRSSLNESLANERGQVAASERAVADKIPATDQFTLGEKLTDAANAEKQAAKIPINKAYDDAFAQAGDAKISGKGILDKTEEILGEKLSEVNPANAPQTVRALRKAITAQEEAAPKEPQSLLGAIRELGGIHSREVGDITGESRGNGVKGVPVGLFHSKGRGIDELATELRDRGYHIPGDIVDGGVNRLRDMILDEINGIKHHSAHDEAQAFGAMRAERDSGPKVADAVDLTLKDLHGIRVAINQDMAAAKRSLDPAASTRLYNLRQVMPELDKAIDGLPGRDAYFNAVAKYKLEYAPRFKDGTPGNVFRDKSTGEARILPDKFVSEFFKPDASAGVTRADQFGKLFGQNGEARKLGHAGILDTYRHSVVDPTTGAVNVGKHDAFLANHGRSLEAFRSQGVNALDDIKAIGNEARTLAGANDRLTDVTKQLKFETTDELVDAALKSPKTMGNVSMRLSPEARKTFGSALLDRSLEAGSGEGMSKFLADNAKTLRMVVPEKQLTALNDISKAMTIAERAPVRGPIQSGGPDALKNATGISTATVFSQIRAVTGGRSSAEWAAINLSMPALNKMSQTNFGNVMKQALHSPESAEALRNYLSSNNPQQANKWATQFLESAKRGGSLAWGLRGPIVKNFVGPQHYPGSFAASGNAIRTQINPEQEQ